MWFSKIINNIIKEYKIKMEYKGLYKDVFDSLNNDWYLYTSDLGCYAIYKKYPNVFIKFQLPIEDYLTKNSVTCLFYVDENHYNRSNVRLVDILDAIKYKKPERLNRIAEATAKSYCGTGNIPILVENMLLIINDGEYVFYTPNSNFSHIRNYFDAYKSGDVIFCDKLDPGIDLLMTLIDNADNKNYKNTK